MVAVTLWLLSPICPKHIHIVLPQQFNFGYTVEPRYNVSRCNFPPVVTFGWLVIGPVRSYMEAIHWIPACSVVELDHETLLPQCHCVAAGSHGNHWLRTKLQSHCSRASEHMATPVSRPTFILNHEHQCVFFTSRSTSNPRPSVTQDMGYAEPRFSCSAGSQTCSIEESTMSAKRGTPPTSFSSSVYSHDSTHCEL